MSFEIPIGEDIVDLLSLTVHHHANGKHTAEPASESNKNEVSSAREALIEAVVSEADDEAAMETYLSSGDVDFQTIKKDFVEAVAHGHFFPVLFTRQNPIGFGIDEVLNLIKDGFPNPTQHSIPTVTDLKTKSSKELIADISKDFVAEVIKTTSDPYLGRISLVRIFSGQIKSDDAVHVIGHFSEDSGHEDHERDEKVGAIFSPFGKTMRPAAVGIAGDIVAITKLQIAETGDTLSAKDSPVLMPVWEIPEPLHPMAVVAHAKSDEDKLATSLHRLVAEDPCVRLERNPETKQTVLWTLGEAHLEVVLDRLNGRYGVTVDAVEFKVPLRETFNSIVSAKGSLVKQSGGHGQYGVCEITVEPLENGAGFEFIDEVVGGAVPRNYIPSVEHGIKNQMERGLLAGYKVVDIRVRLQDGKSHSVDSSDMAFQQAGQLALQEAAQKAGISLLEPVSHVQIEIDDEYVGSVLSDVSTRRGRVTGTVPSDTSGRSVVEAELPDLELVSYSTALRSLSHGTGRFTRKFSRYENMPANIAKAYISQK